MKSPLNTSLLVFFLLHVCTQVPLFICFKIPRDLEPEAKYDTELLVCVTVSKSLNKEATVLIPDPERFHD